MDGSAGLKLLGERIDATVQRVIHQPTLAEHANALAQALAKVGVATKAAWATEDPQAAPRASGAATPTTVTCPRVSNLDEFQPFKRIGCEYRHGLRRKMAASFSYKFCMVELMATLAKAWACQLRLLTQLTPGRQISEAQQLETK